MTFDKEILIEKIFNALVNLESPKRFCIDAITLGVDVKDIMFVISRALDIIGKKYEEGEYFLSDLIVSGENAKECISVIEPSLNIKPSIQPIGRIVVGTIEGDLHDIGKNLFSMFVRFMGFEVIDLGVDVPPEKFAEAVTQYQPDIVAISALLTTVLPNVEKAIKILTDLNLRDKVKVIVGGAAVTREYAKAIGADDGGVDAYEGAVICKNWIEEKHKAEQR